MFRFLIRLFIASDTRSTVTYLAVRDGMRAAGR